MKLNNSHFNSFISHCRDFDNTFVVISLRFFVLRLSSRASFRETKYGNQQILIPRLMSPSSRERIVDNRRDIHFRSPSNWNATVLRRMLPSHQPQPSDPQKLIALPQQPRERIRGAPPSQETLTATIPSSSPPS